ncbi:hypothetical protein AF332_11760 [Sporosarcina globispora]|uniref:Uncharacterized protein n=1 Tax=Sporosarcina globispora TaxID=1459 RepID=A0A0M0GDD2_SPOGL|nr:hypothetical protein [Sporosarcina globispora]KON87436.1 hypothetical protein AF332_11760 [Sporosarcina globispora]
MKEIDDLIIRLRGEMSTRIDDRDIVDILEVLQDANEYFEAIAETSVLYGNLVAKYEKALKEIAEETGTPYARIAIKALES